ncbi:hypothetical protein OG216_00330 [Streptomycetaceae bacterium NBC_01309]
MKRSSVARAVLAAGAALGLVAVSPSSAVAANTNWEYSVPGGNTACGNGFNPTPDTAIAACLLYDNNAYPGYARAFAVFFSNAPAGELRMLPETTVAIPFGQGNTCSMEAISGGGIKYCYGPVFRVNAGCYDIVGAASFVWNTQQTIGSPAVRICR